jgi:hypothetical protein
MLRLHHGAAAISVSATNFDHLMINESSCSGAKNSWITENSEYWLAAI